MSNHRTPLATASTLPELFRGVAAARSTAPAVVDRDHVLDYRELDRESDVVAARLADLGVRRGDLVGLMLDRGADIPVGVLGVLKAGAAYVPLDPAYPAERLRYMVSDAGLRVVIGDPESAADRGLTDIAVMAPHVDDVLDLPVPRPQLDGADPAYVIYTSGSSGQPKGCVVSHRNVLALLRAALPLFDVDHRDRWALFHSFSFDVSVWEFWAAVATGATAVAVPAEAARSAEALLDLLAGREVTVLGQVPSVFRAVATAYEDTGRPPLSLRYLVFAGESVNLEVISGFLASYRGTPPAAVNMYGPTEATVYATHRLLTRTDFDGPIASPIGDGLPHLTLGIRDEQLQPVPDGEVGELLIAGAGVTDGYLNRPELTAERFVTLDGVRHYRTGDLARKLPDGAFDYLGRADQQIKLRGYRIELGEIETALRACDGVRDAAVTVVTTAAAAQFLVACVVLADHAGTDRTTLLRKHMLTVLPRHTVPDRYQVVDELPLTGSGKLDRRALGAIASRRRR
ncbi:amino acid adenylation domain-containing protein [Kutzneria sp. CA-103260]|uniref:amino acid adenylation domain-containing protein n=1 Tax=Kutzneria sp. CA-103260 TaxID=2802641 RepID=UPI001BAA48CA|nr:amino acid adenylation domain-containing protein [Kutzneria sp. CA-103260]QUQ67047.1 amino acid adenylation domain-containing protein [Kutzneria sp. CA-103260]